MKIPVLRKNLLDNITKMFIRIPLKIIILRKNTEYITEQWYPVSSSAD